MAMLEFWPTVWMTLAKFVFFVLLFVMPLAAVLTWMERRQSAYSQDRLGPTRAHFVKVFGRPFVALGLFHVVADALKMFFKESFTPATADRLIYRVAPAIGFVMALLVAALIPFGPDITTGLGGAWHTVQLQIARIDTGILLVFAVGSLGVYGAALAGWSSNNRFALLGGLRATAQSISYEIALGLAVVGILITFGSTELSTIVTAQDGTIFHGLLPRWGIFVQPFAAVLFLVAGIAETKRGPFDLPEGESEIIGYFVEYSSMGFGLFMLGEFIEIVILAALFVTLFLGGWQMPWFLGDHTLSIGFATYEIGPWVRGIAGFVFFAVKVFLMSAFQLQVRWTLPRFRYDQLMRLGWKSLLPLALVNIFVTAFLVWWDPTLELLAVVSVVAICLFVLVVIAGPRRRSEPVAAAVH